MTRPDLHEESHTEWDQGGYCNNLVLDDGCGEVCGYRKPLPEVEYEYAAGYVIRPPRRAAYTDSWAQYPVLYIRTENEYHVVLEPVPGTTRSISVIKCDYQGNTWNVELEVKLDRVDQYFR